MNVLYKTLNAEKENMRLLFVHFHLYDNILIKLN